MGKRPATVDDIIKFILAHTPLETAQLKRNPFIGRNFRREMVDAALYALRKKELCLDMEPFDLPGTKHLWREGGEIKYELAHKATRQLVKTLQARQPRKSLEEIVTGISQDVFQKTPINRYGTRLSGMLQHVYGNSPYKALKDLFDHDDKYSALRDVQPYDMERSRRHTWMNSNGKWDYTLCRNATKQLLLSLQKQYDVPLENLINLIKAKDFRSGPINQYGTTLGAMFIAYHGSPYRAMKDLFDHDSEFAHLRDIQPYDMGQACNNVWKHHGRLNYELARRAVRQFLHALHSQHSAVPFKQIVSQLKVRDTESLPINKYGTHLKKVIDKVYCSSLRLAFKDIANHDRRYGWLLPIAESMRRYVA